MKPESKFWKQVKENLTQIHWTRFENRIGQGVPDCYGISAGISVWVELKVIRSNKIVLSPFKNRGILAIVYKAVETSLWPRPSLKAYSTSFRE